MNSKMAVLIALLAMSAFEGITVGVTEQDNEVREEYNLIIDFGGSPSVPNAIPGGDPEHPQ